MRLQEALRRDVERIVNKQYHKRMCYKELCSLVLKDLVDEYSYHIGSVLEWGRMIKREIDNQLENIAKKYG